ncbi:hypothetical protein [Arsenicicoccus sp. oral taxon 190]|uniref:hypothetical protein n=1 Tax=Arsenicicoccus sp. oral taxon 190 TaxID=1658671 RepID=UPI000A8E4694|nr:hypothetical protein [Arsenicicoccus sp. oral taxon 190]
MNPTVAASVRPLLDLPGVTDAVAAARESCTQLRWHQALRRRIPEAAAESRVRGARETAFLEGIQLPVETVRDLSRGALAWAATPRADEQVVRGAVQVTAEAEHLRGVLRAAPRQVVARLHTAAASPLGVPEATLGRPRAAGDACAELVELGAPAAAELLPARLEGIVELLGALDAVPVGVVAALVHAEVAVARPFGRGNGLVARALERVVVQAGGLDPTGVAVPEAGHRLLGQTAYAGALAAYATGSPDGVRLWLLHCCSAMERAAAEGTRVADAVLAGRTVG